MLNNIHTFFNAFGATVIVPIMIFIIALFLKVKPKKAMMCGFDSKLYRFRTGNR